MRKAPKPGTPVKGKDGKLKPQPSTLLDGGGLRLQIGPNGSKAWIFRYMIASNSREMGLGPYPTVELAEAREQALQLRKLILQGVDPISARAAAAAQSKVDAAMTLTFEKCAEKYIEAHKAGWKNAKHTAQWTSTLETYAYPIIRNVPVSNIDVGLILAILEKDNLWHTKTETASRLRGRIETILDWATTREFRQGPNPARWKGHLDKTLPKRAKVQKVVHYPALPYTEAATFMKELRGQSGIAAQALELIILTATRTGEAIAAQWTEFDLGKRLWTIPEGRMKAGREHKVPLCNSAVTLLQKVAKMKSNDFVFPGTKKNSHLSNMACLELLKRMARSDITVHGFRSTFRDWAAEQTNFAREVAEQALAHTLGDKVEASYRRGDLLEKRRKLMTQWGEYCSHVESAKVRQIGTARKAKAG